MDGPFHLIVVASLVPYFNVYYSVEALTKASTKYERT